jgi:hypothetical protein
MSDFLSETEGCDLLSRLFRMRGYSITRNQQFREYGVEFHVDGWDAKARVGFEFLSSEDDDHDDLTLDEFQELSAAQQRGELSLFIIDEVEPLSAADLAASANEFLDEVAAAVRARREGSPVKKKAAAKKLPAKKADTKKVVVKQAVAKKPVAKKPVSKKPLANKKPVAKKPVAKKPADAVRKSEVRSRVVSKKAVRKKSVTKKSAPSRTGKKR